MSINLGAKMMDDQDLKILGAMNEISPMSFVSPIEVNEIVKLNKMDLGDRLILMKKSGHVDVVTRDFVSSMTLPNFIAKIKLTDLGRRALKEKG
jgi:uncharacterized protein YwlG (UPF0340 family)